jgi:hypothetical protein
MRFLMWVCVDEALAAMAEADPSDWVAVAGPRRLEGARLADVENATTLRPQEGGGILVSDGPFAETKEQIAGYDILECRDMAEAVELAARHPAAGFGAIEVRAVWQ